MAKATTYHDYDNEGTAITVKAEREEDAVFIRLGSVKVEIDADTADDIASALTSAAEIARGVRSV